ncbi:MAG TPA: hypothetical protein VFA20_03410 [Myxococcaceae bacterium]|nr:hypothetical protein [Myxococcaceae bacterium]
MRFGFGTVVLCSLTMAWAACQCGGKPCSSNSDCNPGDVCGPNGTCTTPGNGDGGDGGGGGGDGGDGGDGGRLPDGGTCVGLQCQQVTCPTGSPTRITGSVYDPSGQVALYNAIVYVPNAALKPLPTGLTCDQCGSLVSGNPVAIALTGPDGKFQLDNVPVGNNIPLVIQVGKWRRQITLPFNVQGCTTQPITDVSLLHLPQNQGQGDIPQMAIATGNADPFECLLLKMGISYGEMTAPAANGRIHFYHDNTGGGGRGGLYNDAGYDDVVSLIGDAGTMSRYDVVLLPCIGSEKFGANPGTTQQGWTQNLINYTGSGGRLFTTHYGYVWMAYAQAPFNSTAVWTPDPNQTHNPPNPWTVDVNQGFPKGAAFAQWLWDAGASTTFGQLSVRDTRHDCSGTDAGTTTWLSGINPTNGAGYSVQHLTFNTPYNPPPLPDGDAGTQCGRVVFSDFHVTATALIGTGANHVFPHDCAGGAMTPQEKALVFMLFDVSSCVQNDNTAPQVCKTVNDLCSRDADCCNGLACVDANQMPCFEGSCSCQVVIN